MSIVNWDFKKKDESGENKRERKGTLDENALFSSNSETSDGDDPFVDEIEVESTVL